MIGAKTRADPGSTPTQGGSARQTEHKQFILLTDHITPPIQRRVPQDPRRLRREGLLSLAYLLLLLRVHCRGSVLGFTKWQTVGNGGTQSQGSLWDSPAIERSTLMRCAINKVALSFLCAAGLIVAGGQAMAADTETVEQMLGGSAPVDFTFEADPMLVPPTINPAQVMTVTTTRQGETVEGVVLLIDGRTVPFTMTHSRPLLEDQAASQIGGGGILGAETSAHN